MQIIRVFPRRTSYTPTDIYAFVGDPPLMWQDEGGNERPLSELQSANVHVSVTFTWDVAEGMRLAAAWREHFAVVRIGGPAIRESPFDFSPCLYVKPGVTFTSRGCNNACPWCLVPQREGWLRPSCPVPPGNIIADNNFLQCPRKHRRRVYEMLGTQSSGAVFSGGLQPSLVTDEVASEFRDIRIKDVFLAADTTGAIAPLEKAVARLSFLAREKLRCYVMIGYGDETVEQAEQRLRRVWEIGAMPFAMLYQPSTDTKREYSQEWRHLARTWSRPAAMKAEMRRCGVTP